jgi:hypothetical protein
LLDSGKESPPDIAAVSAEGTGERTSVGLTTFALSLSVMMMVFII